jgi:hypothetical protein
MCVLQNQNFTHSLLMYLNINMQNFLNSSSFNFLFQRMFYVITPYLQFLPLCSFLSSDKYMHIISFIRNRKGYLLHKQT